MEISELEAFVTVVDTGSFSQAALRLGRVQSSISLRIKGLEEKLGVVLLRRRYDGTSATAAGSTLYKFAVEIIALAHSAKEAVRASGEENKITIGFIEVIKTTLVNLILEQFSKDGKCADAQGGHTEDLFHKVLNGVLDAAIIGGGFASPEVIRTPLYAETLVLVSSPEEKKLRSLTDLRSKKFYVHNKRSASGRNLDLLFSEMGGVPPKVAECGSYNVLFSAISRGASFCLVAETTFNDHKDRFNIECHSIRGRFSIFQVDLVYLKAFLNPQLPALSRTIIDFFHKK